MSVETVHRVAVGALALLIGLFEGPAQIALLATVVTTAATGRLRGYRPGPIEAAVALWVAVGYLGLLETETVRVSSAGALSPLHALAVIVGARGLKGLRLTPYVGLVLAGIGVNAAYGLLQVFVLDPPLEAIITGHVRATDLADPDAPHRLTMARGLFYNRLKLAHVGVVQVALGLIVATRPRLPARTRLAAGLVAGLVLVAVLLTFRRAVPLALAVGGVALLAVRGRRRAIAGVVLVGLGLVIGLSMSSVGQRRIESLRKDWTERQLLFARGVAVWRTQPIVGVGHGDYEGVVTALAPDGPPGLPTSSPHNQALNTLAETGVLGALGLFGALAGALWVLGARLRRELDPLHAQAFVTLVILSALGLVHAVLHHPSVAILWWLAIGVAAGAREAPDSGPRAE